MPVRWSSFSSFACLGVFDVQQGNIAARKK
jgi:hypothetical protein